MSPVFSALPPFFQEERAAHHFELQLVSDDDLMDIWEQTQRAVYMLEEKGWDPMAALHYCNVLVWEMQRRLARLPQGRPFGAEPQDGRMEAETADLPHVVPQIVTVRV